MKLARITMLAVLEDEHEHDVSEQELFRDVNESLTSRSQHIAGLRHLYIEDADADAEPDEREREWRVAFKRLSGMHDDQPHYWTCRSREHAAMMLARADMFQPGHPAATAMEYARVEYRECGEWEVYGANCGLPLKPPTGGDL